MGKPTKEDIEEQNASLSEFEESIHHIEEIRNIEEKQKRYTAKIKMNRVQEEFIFDTGSPVTKMPLDERKVRMVKQAEIQKITSRYPDGNKNEVNSLVKIPADMECEKNKQKIGRIQFLDNNQSQDKSVKRT